MCPPDEQQNNLTSIQVKMFLTDVYLPREGDGKEYLSH